jgi:hypothetical protein
MLPRRHQYKERQWLRGQALEPPTPRAPGAIEHQGFLRIQRDQGLLGRGEARRVQRMFTPQSMVQVFDSHELLTVLSADL